VALVAWPLGWVVPAAPPGPPLEPSPDGPAGWILLGSAAAVAAALAIFARRAGQRAGGPAHRDPGPFPADPTQAP